MQPVGHIQSSTPRLCSPNLGHAASLALRLLLKTAADLRRRIGRLDPPIEQGCERVLAPGRLPRAPKLRWIRSTGQAFQCNSPALSTPALLSCTGQALSRTCHKEHPHQCCGAQLTPAAAAALGSWCDRVPANSRCCSVGTGPP